LVSWGGAGMQAVFLFYISQKFALPKWSLGSFFYLTANLATVLVGAIFYDKHPKLHIFFTRYYFFAMPLSLILISNALKSFYPFVLILSVLLVIGYGLGQFGLFRKYKIGNVYIEGLGFVILSVWTLVVMLLR
jgi:hypothetical protein